MGRLTHRTTPGFTYFVTTKTWQNHEVFRVAENAEIVVECILRYRDDGAYQLHEFVVMPNHLHLLLTPAVDATVETAMQFIKGGSSHQIHKVRGHKMQIWQPGFHEESVRDQEDYRRKTEYIRSNPVESHLVKNAGSWLFSSAAKQYRLDPMPERLKILSSGAKAPEWERRIVGAKAPTP
jgi:putative transposase